MNVAIHHFLRKYKDLDEEALVNNQGFRRFINRSIYFIGIFGVLVIVPQILKIWVDRDFGVSMTTWVGFFICAFFWLLYGLIHKEKPIIITNLAVMSADLMVILGLILLK